MSIGPLRLPGLEKVQIPTPSKLLSPVLSPPLPSNIPMDARLVAARLPGLAMYGSPYTSPNFPGYLPYGPAAAAAVAAADPSAFYPPMGHGENTEAWRAGLSQAAAAVYYDPSMAAHYGYGYGPMGLSDGARRKNATRETTSTLKAWLNEHRKNPYPTKGEKIMLAIITKMTLTQVSTWFANARRRLKKENKMTWSPRNRCGEDDEDDDDINEDGNHGNENPGSPSSTTPLGPGTPHGGERRPQFNGHTSGGESLSDEGASYSDGRDDSMRMKSEDFAEKKDEKSSPSLVSRQPSVEESRNRLPSAHLTRHAGHPYANPRSSPAFKGIPHNLSPPVQSRPGLPFPAPVPHIPGVSPHPGMLQPGHFNPAAAASLLAASRGHPLPPHIVAALNEQAHLQHYQQALQSLPMNPLFPSPLDASKSGSSPSPAPSSSTSPMTSSKSSVTSPPKPKIWSLADVATAIDTPKSKAPESRHVTSSGDHKAPETSPKESPRSWVDSMIQHKLAFSGQNGLPAAPVTPQQLQQFAAGLTSAPSASIGQQTAPGLPQGFPGLADIMAAQEKAKVSIYRAMVRSQEQNRSNQDLIERASLSSNSHSPELRDDFEKSSNSRFIPSPRNGQQASADSSVELSEKK